MAEKKTEGAEPRVVDPWRMDPWTRAMTSAFQFWLSFWPVAPLFGVEWRFAELAGMAEPSGGTQTKTETKTGAKTETKTGAKTGAKSGAKSGAKTETNSGARAERAAERPDRIESATPEAATESAAPTTPAAPAEKAGRKDDLTRIKGIGPGVARQLETLGIRSFAQLAALTPEELSEVDAKLTSIRGSCYRNDWVGQAKALAG